MDAAQNLAGENGFDRMSGDEELGEEKFAQTSNGQKRSRHEFEVDSDDGNYETNDMNGHTNGKDAVSFSLIFFSFDRFDFFSGSYER